jgi:ectoine hydroxylase-related dioxygenase (phytanoyl-CoA dioxygenase family)
MGMGMWIALHDATAANGTMHMIPGVQNEVLEHTRDPFSDHHSRCYPPEEKAVAIEIPAGGALFFSYGVPHCTKENSTDRERAGLALHFLRKDHTPENIDRVGKHPRPLINGPDASGGEREYGVRVSGTWEQEVDRVLGREAGVGG